MDAASWQNLFTTVGIPTGILILVFYGLWRGGKPMLDKITDAAAENIKSQSETNKKMADLMEKHGDRLDKHTERLDGLHTKVDRIETKMDRRTT